jgi:chlorobactene glucosyltransferase
MNSLVVISYTIFGILLLLFVHFLINLLSIRKLKATTKRSISFDPFVSLLVPARNEEAHIELCVRSLVGQHYERLEVLVLDDQSSDATAAIVQRVIDELSPAQRGRLRLLRGEQLPPGWVGKNFACYQLFQQAQGDYLFFTDADTVHAPGIVRAVIDCMQALKVDLLTAQAEHDLKGIGERLIEPLISFRIFTLLPLMLVSWLPDPILSTGNGPLLCFRRVAYTAIGGHRSIKERILEDLSLARAIKAAGYRMAYVDAHEMLYCHMYTSFAKTWVGFSRTFFAFYSYSLIGAFAIIMFDFMLFVVPLLLLLWSLFAPLPLTVIQFSLGSYGIAVLMRLLLAIRLARSQKLLTLLFCFLHPATILLGSLILLNSIRWYYRKLGTEWKGRYYPSQEHT